VQPRQGKRFVCEQDGEIQLVPYVDLKYAAGSFETLEVLPSTAEAPTELSLVDEFACTYHRTS
jgi:hypothetical protein